MRFIFILLSLECEKGVLELKRYRIILFGGYDVGRGVVFFLLFVRSRDRVSYVKGRIWGRIFFYLEFDIIVYWCVILGELKGSRRFEF